MNETSAVKISFDVKKLPFYSVCHKNGRKTLEIQAFDGILTLSVQYDFERLPLSLSGEIEEGDKVEALLFTHRIELYINGILQDEEWPAGKMLFKSGDKFTFCEGIKVCEYKEKEADLPSVISSFENAEGWYPGNGVFVGDCMPYRKDGEYHVLYLKDRHHHRSKWGLGAHQWEHISTKDFKKWNIHPMAVPITDPSEGSICTGSWIRSDNKEYLYYTVRRGKGEPATICRSISLDGYHFTKDTDFGFTVSEKYHAASARDPKVISGEDGAFHMFLTTSLLSEGKGCLAHYISLDMESWSECESPIYIAPDGAQPECPDYFKYNGKYYLIFSLHGRAHYMFSDKPFKDFVMPENPIIPCASVPKGAFWDNRIIFIGFKGIGGYAGSMTFMAARSSDSGELIFEEL
ncbi:MAG: hypothetical protein E7633_04260 [Ruminococcaceae bacterium]|nr:hypothetical protein [Oscillospiraceae bacterium]